MELSGPPHSAAEGCRFLIHFTFPMYLRGSLRNYPVPPIPLQRGIVFLYISPFLCGSAVACGIIRSLYSAAERFRFLIHFTSPIWLRGSLRNYPPIPNSVAERVVFSCISLLLCGSAVACGIIRSFPFRCRGASFSHTFYFSYVAPR